MNTRVTFTYRATLVSTGDEIYAGDEIYNVSRRAEEKRREEPNQRVSGVRRDRTHREHDHSLWLYPAPHCLVLGDRTEQQALAKFEDTELVNPGSFADDGRGLFGAR